jgi:hypothetical protein
MYRHTDCVVGDEQMVGRLPVPDGHELLDFSRCGIIIDPDRIDYRELPGHPDGAF